MLVSLAEPLPRTTEIADASNRRATLCTVDADTKADANEAFARDTHGVSVAVEYRMASQDSNTLILPSVDKVRGTAMQFTLRSVIGITSADVIL